MADNEKSHRKCIYRSLLFDTESHKNYQKLVLFEAPLLERELFLPTG